MSDKYLLPCTCGETIVVERRQAGTTVNCVCGKSLEVPTIRELTSLATAGETTEDLPPIWSLWQGLVFLGLVIALPAFAFAIFEYRSIQTLYEESGIDRIEQALMQISPEQSWMLWREYQNGMPKAPTLQSVATIHGIQKLRLYTKVGVIIGVIGLLISASGFLVKRVKAPVRTPATGSRKS